MSIDFNAGCYLVDPNDTEWLIEQIYQIFAKYGFEYRPGRGYVETFTQQLERMSKKEDDFFWLSEKDKSILLGLFHIQQMGVDKNHTDNISMFSLSFHYEHITAGNSEDNQRFLHKTIKILEEIYELTKSELAWAGYSEDAPSLEDYLVGKVHDIFWFNIFGSRFVNSLGKEKLLSAPGWQIKERSDGSFVVQLSEHPYAYEKINDIYLHEYLELNYNS